jgi:2-polyprenyl-6-methoxyphenol hydroxylase-like FAD-dependent oxidoreductase
MAETAASNGRSGAVEERDVVIVGASLAGCAAASFLGRAGASVALVDQRPEEDAFKRICSHYIQASAVATVERLGLLEPMVAAGALRSRGRIWTLGAWIEPPANSRVPAGVNLRREVLDPLIRRTAAQAPGVELMLGRTAQELVRDGDRIRGVLVRDRGGELTELRGRLVVGADGRDSRVAKLADVRRKTYPHGRFAYGGYFEGPKPAGWPNASLWFLNPDMAAAFPTDSDLTFYAAMPAKERLGEFKGDPAGALVDFVSRVPEAPPIASSRLVGPVQGKIDMTNVAHDVTAPGLALIGDAALATDPLWGVGCGFALQSAEWLSDSVAPALAAGQDPRRGLARYRRRFARGLRGHAAMIHDYAGGRRFTPPERLLFSAASESERLAEVMEAFGTRSMGPAQMMLRGMPLALLVGARRALARRGPAGPQAAAHSGGISAGAR